MKCRDCGKDGFSGPYAVSQHKIEAHGAKPKKRRKKKATQEPTISLIQQVGGLDPEVDAEAALFAAVSKLFAESEGTGPDEDARVLAHLTARFSSQPEIEE